MSKIFYGEVISGLFLYHADIALVILIHRAKDTGVTLPKTAWLLTVFYLIITINIGI